MSTKSTLFWDLDGTLTDPREGIIGCILHALRHAGRPVVLPAMDDLLWTIGPPLIHSFRRILEEDGLSGEWRESMARDCVAKYRERFAEVGMFENAVYPGIPELLAELHARGHRMFLATSKPHVYAKQILAHFGLAPYFAAMHGSELDGRNGEKPELLAHILREEKLDPADVIMIGDRHYDALGAKANGVRSLGVLWGYGSRAELLAAGAASLFASPAELREFLVG